MANKPLLRTTMDWVEASPQHDNREYALRKPGEVPTFCFATYMILNVHPDARLVWCKDSGLCRGMGWPVGTEWANKIELPGGEVVDIWEYARGLGDLTWHEAGDLFTGQNTKDSLRRRVDTLTS